MAMLKLLRIAMLAMALVVVASSTASACPGCKEATSEQSLNLARGFSYSILLMMPLPFIMVGSFGGYVYYVVRKREREQAEAAAKSGGQEPRDSRST